MPVMIGINITSLQVAYVRERFEGHKASERYGLLLEVSQPPVSAGEMPRLQCRPGRNKLVEGVDRVGERDAVNFLDSIGHQGILALILMAYLNHSRRHLSHPA